MRSLDSDGANPATITDMHGAPRETLRVEELRTVESFQAIAREWNELCDRAIESVPMLRHAFILAWYASFGDGLELRIVLVWEGDTLVAGAPLGFRKERLYRQDLRVVSLLTNAWVDRSSILLARADGALVDTILSAVLASDDQIDVLSLAPIDENSVVAGLIRESARRNRWPHGEEVMLRSPFLSMPGSWEELLAGLSSSLRGKVRRHLRQAEQTPGLRIEIVEDASCLSAINSISPETWQAEEGTAMTSRPEIVDFYRAVIEDAAESGALRCGLLWDGETVVAFDFNIRFRNTLHSLKMGFRSSHSALSAGAILRAYLLRDFIAHPSDGPLEYDFMGTTEPYKLGWTSTVRSHSRHLIFARKPRLLLTHWIFFGVKPFLRQRAPKLWTKLKQLKRR